jgi:hypothetical protein
MHNSYLGKQIDPSFMMNGSTKGILEAKMASQYQVVESATIQMPKEQFDKMVQLSASTGTPLQTLLSQQNGIFSKKMMTTQHQQHFQQTQQQTVAKSYSTPNLYTNVPMLPSSEYVGFIQEFRDVKLETFDLDVSFVQKCLEMNNITGDMKMFQKMYLEGVSREFIPIRHIKKIYQYWLNGHMNDDMGGQYIKNTVSRNIEILYMKANIYDRYEDRIEKFMNNQEHIGKFSDEKYKDKILLQISLLVSI